MGSCSSQDKYACRIETTFPAKESLIRELKRRNLLEKAFEIRVIDSEKGPVYGFNCWLSFQEVEAWLVWPWVHHIAVSNLF